MSVDITLKDENRIVTVNLVYCQLGNNLGSPFRLEIRSKLTGSSIWNKVVHATK